MNSNDMYLLGYIGRRRGSGKARKDLLRRDTSLQARVRLAIEELKIARLSQLYSTFTVVQHNVWTRYEQHNDVIIKREFPRVGVSLKLLVYRTHYCCS